MKTLKCKPDIGSIPILVIQPNDQLIISMDIYNYRPINGSNWQPQNFKMHAPNSNEKYLKNTLQFGGSIKVSMVQPSGHITICVDP